MPGYPYPTLDQIDGDTKWSGGYQVPPAAAPDYGVFTATPHYQAEPPLPAPDEEMVVNWGEVGISVSRRF